MVTMSNSQVVITRAVLQHMAHEGLSQSQMGKLIGMQQPVLSRKLTGSRRWIIDDLDALITAGVNLESIAHAMTGREGD